MFCGGGRQSFCVSGPGLWFDRHWRAIEGGLQASCQTKDLSFKFFGVLLPDKVIGGQTDVLTSCVMTWGDHQKSLHWQSPGTPQKTRVQNLQRKHNIHVWKIREVEFWGTYRNTSYTQIAISHFTCAVHFSMPEEAPQIITYQPHLVNSILHQR